MNIFIQVIVIGFYIPLAMSLLVNNHVNNKSGFEKSLQLIGKIPSFLGLKGIPINVKCPLNGSLIEWFIIMDPYGIPKVYKNLGNLTIKHPTSENSGKYTCESVGGFSTETIQVPIKIIDSLYSNQTCQLKKFKNKYRGLCFMRERDDQFTVKPGSDVNLDCEVVERTYDSKPSLGATHKWRFKDRFQFLELKVPSNTSKILIKNITSKYEGKYTCEVTLKTKFKEFKLKKEIAVYVLREKDLISTKLLETSDNGKQEPLLQCHLLYGSTTCMYIKWALSFSKSSSIPPELYKGRFKYRDQYYYFFSDPKAIKTRILMNRRIISKMYYSRLSPSMGSDIISIMCKCIDYSNKPRYQARYHDFPVDLRDLFTTATPLTSLVFTNSPIHHRRAPPTIVYILLPAFVILITLTCIIFCCIRYTRNTMSQYGHTNTSSTINKPLYTQPNQPQSPQPPQAAASFNPQSFPHQLVYNSAGRSSNSYCTTNNV